MRSNTLTRVSNNPGAVQSPGSSSKAIFQAVAVVNGVDQSKIEYVNAAPSALNQVLLNRDVHATITYFPDNVPFLRSKGAKVDFSGTRILGSTSLERASTYTHLSSPRKPTPFAVCSVGSAEASGSP